MFGLATGVALLAASVLAGVLWQFASPAATFWTAAVFAALAMLWTAARTRRRASSAE